MKDQKPELHLKITLEGGLGYFTEKSYVLLKPMTFEEILKTQEIFGGKKTDAKQTTEFVTMLKNLFLGGEWETHDKKTQSMTIEDFERLIPSCLARLSTGLTDVMKVEDADGLKVSKESKRK